MSEQYRKNFNRLAQAATQRARLAGREPQLIDLVDQVAIRSLTHSRSTVNVELTSLRKIAKGGQHDETGLSLPNDVDDHQWIRDAGPEELRGLLEILAQPTAAILDRAKTALDRDMAAPSMTVLDLSEDEAAGLLSGGARQERPSQKDQRHITERDLQRFDLELSDHDRVEAWKAALRGDAAIDSGGLLRVFMRVIFLTGMRPIEVWSSRLLVPNVEYPFKDVDREMVRATPEKAIHEGLVIPVDQVMFNLGEMQAGIAAIHAQRRAGAPSLLVIQSAKQTNVKADIKPMRIQVLPDASHEDLATIGMATLLRRSSLNDKRRINIVRSMNRKLKSVLSDHPAYQDMNVNLYSFRHSFVTRARSALGDTAAAALVGHSARGSLYHYGERALRGRRGSSSWLPEPDPVRIAELEAYWAQDAGLEMEQGPAAAALGDEEPDMNPVSEMMAG